MGLHELVLNASRIWLALSEIEFGHADLTPGDVGGELEKVYSELTNLSNDVSVTIEEMHKLQVEWDEEATRQYERKFDLDHGWTPEGDMVQAWLSRVEDESELGLDFQYEAERGL